VAQKLPRSKVFQEFEVRTKKLNPEKISLCGGPKVVGAVLMTGVISSVPRWLAEEPNPHTVARLFRSLK